MRGSNYVRVGVPGLANLMNLAPYGPYGEIQQGPEFKSERY